MANGQSKTAFEPTYGDERARFCFNYKRVTSEQSCTDAVRNSPLISLAVKFAIDKPTSLSGDDPDGASPHHALYGSTVAAATSSSNSSSAASSQLSTSMSKPGLSTRIPNVFGAPYLSSGAEDLQDKRRTPNQNDSAPSAVKIEVPKLVEQCPPTKASSAGIFTPAKIFTPAMFGEENVATQFIFTSQPPHRVTRAMIKAAPSPNGHVAASSKTTDLSALSSSFEPNRKKEEGGMFDSSLSITESKQASSPVESAKKDPTLPRYGLLGFDLDNCDTEGNPEPILLNTNSPSSFFLCGSQGSGKSYTLSCMLENHLLNNQSVGVQREAIPGFVFHWDTNTSGSLAEAASLCSRGIKVRVLVSWSNYRQMRVLYKEFAPKAGGKIEVRPLLFQDTELTVNNIRNLMAFRDATTEAPLYLEVVQNMLRRLGRQNQKFSVTRFLQDLSAANFSPSQIQMLDQRLNILKTFSAATAPDIFMSDNKGLVGKSLAKERKKQGLDFIGDCITVEQGALTIIDLSDPFVDASTACVLFDICLGIIPKSHKEAVTANKISPGLIITLDEAHKFLDKDITAAEIFTNYLLTTIREQRHNSARVVLATQEPTISEKLLDLCSVSIVHRFNSPAWFNTLCGHLGGASSLTNEKAEEGTVVKKEELFGQILALQVGESLVFSPTSYVRGGAAHIGDAATEPARLGSGVLRMKTRERKGDDSGKTWTVV